MNTYKILIVEDDRGLNRGIALALKEETVEFLSALTLAQAQEIWKNNAVDMVLLDVNLPDGSGYELLKEIRLASQIPVLMLTANDLEIDEVTGFRLGADDYITKPFSLMVLRARVERMRFRIRQTESYGYEDERFQFFYDEMRYLVYGLGYVWEKRE